MDKPSQVLRHLDGPVKPGDAINQSVAHRFGQYGTPMASRGKFCVIEEWL